MLYTMAKNWTIEDSANLYNLKGWSLKYFDINSAGHLTVHPRRSPEPAIDVKNIVDDAIGRGIKPPVLFRFQDILRHRVELLNESFRRAIEDHKYKGRYFGVYPIKVNQLCEVVEEVLDAGRSYQYGLEAGSKGELLAVLAMNGAQSLTILNGYKDESMMRLALMGVRLGKKVIVVIEKPSEIKLLLKASRDMDVRPHIGLRCKLQTQGLGRWKYSTGHASKFGLTSPELLGAVEDFAAAGMKDCVKLLHFHIGSQISDIQTIKDACKEGARVYAKLRKKKLDIEYLDCGGGLGVDYDGTHTAVDSSTNYTPREYVNGIVYTIQEVCKQEKVPEPNIVTESGRSVVAHHSLLVVDVVGTIESGATPVDLLPSLKEADVVVEMRETLQDLNPKNLAESYHDAVQRREEAFSMFKLGYLELDDKAKVENLFWRICLEIDHLLPKAKYISEDLLEMVKTVRAQYLCNFSVFQSLPDSWAIGQLFPIIPLHRLQEEPTQRAALVDITCDSDGKIAQFACHRKTGGALPLHPLRNGEPYFLGFFLMGAYQATMGDIHNLFGRVNEVHVFQDEGEPGGYYLEEVVHGQTVKDMLNSVQYHDAELIKLMKDQIDAQVRSGAVKPREGVDLLDAYEAAMGHYTYIDRNAIRVPEEPAPDKAKPAPIGAVAKPA